MNILSLKFKHKNLIKKQPNYSSHQKFILLQMLNNANCAKCNSVTMNYKVTSGEHAMVEINWIFQLNGEIEHRTEREKESYYKLEGRGYHREWEKPNEASLIKCVLGFLHPPKGFVHSSVSSCSFSEKKQKSEEIETKQRPFSNLFDAESAHAKSA